MPELVDKINISDLCPPLPPAAPTATFFLGVARQGQAFPESLFATRTVRPWTCFKKLTVYL